MIYNIALTCPGIYIYEKIIGVNTKKILYIFLTLTFFVFTDNGLLSALHPCGMACCSSEYAQGSENIVPACCKSADIRPCNCRIEPPAKSDTDRIPQTETLRSSFIQTLFFLAAVLNSDYSAGYTQEHFYDSYSFDIYNSGIIVIFSGRAPPRV